MALYRLPSPNSCIVLPSGVRVLSHDGVVDTDALRESHEGIDAHLEDMVRVRNAHRIDRKNATAETKISVPSIVPKAQAADPLAVHSAAADSVMGMFDSTSALAASLKK
jgi:hypothetical protein